MDNLSFIEYLWLDGSAPTEKVLSKSRVLSFAEVPTTADFPEWRSIVSPADRESEGEPNRILHPVRYYRDPFRCGNHYIVLCEVRDSGGNSHASNKRALLRAAIKTGGQELDAWLGCEQIYTLEKTNHSLNTLEQDAETSDISAYCHEKVSTATHREVAETHALACVGAGICLGGFSEGPGHRQWKFQLGYRGLEGEACDILTVADDIWVARYLLDRVAETFNVEVFFGRSKSTGIDTRTRMPVFFSTSFSRDPRCGATAINAIAKRLNADPYNHTISATTMHEKQYSATQMQKHDESTGRKCSDSIDKNVVCIPFHVKQRGYGYVEDRRPAANADPYQIGAYLMQAVAYETKKLQLMSREARS